MSAPFRFPKFFVTSPTVCPYLPGKTERKVFTELNGAHAAELNDALGRIGFRRSQSVAYRPSCPDCTACVSVRVVVDEWEPNSTQKRTLKRNQELEVSACRPWSTDEQFQLLRRYLSARHPGGELVHHLDEVGDVALRAGGEAVHLPGGGAAQGGGEGDVLALGVVGVGSFLHYLDLASRGDIPPSQVSNFAGSGLDDPSSTYLFGVVLCAAFSLLCTVYILYTVRRDRRRAPRPHRE